MLDQLTRYFAPFQAAKISNAQSEAILELLVWTMYIDKSIKVAEEVELAHQASELAWTGQSSRGQFVDETSQRIKKLMGDEIGTFERLETLGQQLGSPELKQQALAACEMLARADGDFSDQEQRWLDAVRRAFKA